MNREEIVNNILDYLKEEFEIVNPDLNDNLTEKYEFDSIDAIALLEHIENFAGSPLTQEEKKQALEIRTIRQICDYVEAILKNRAAEPVKSIN